MYTLLTCHPYFTLQFYSIVVFFLSLLLFLFVPLKGNITCPCTPNQFILQFRMMLVVYMCVLSAYMCAHARENHNRDHIVIIDIIKGASLFMPSSLRGQVFAHIGNVYSA